MGIKLHGKFLWIILMVPALLWGQTCPTSVSVASSAGNEFCEGTSVTFTATANGGTGTFTYQWRVNGTNQGTASTNNTFTTSSLTNGQKVSVRVIDASGTTCTVTSTDYTVTTIAIRTPIVNISVNSGVKCVGTNIQFTAVDQNGGNSSNPPTFAWFVNGSSTASQNGPSKQFSTTALPVGNNSVRVVMTSGLSCVSTPTAENTASVTITGNANVALTSGTASPALCINTSLTPIVFTVSGSGSNANATGLPSGITGSYNSSTKRFTISGTPTVSGSFPYTVKATGPCQEKTITGTITVNPNATISLDSGNSTQTVCQGEAISDIIYSFGQTGTGASVTGLPSGITGSISGGKFTLAGSSNVIGTHNYTIRATGTCGNSQVLNGSIVINENLTPTVSLTSSDADNTICAGIEVTYTASITNGGTNPSFQWKINGSNSGAATTSNTFTKSDFNNGDVVSVTLTSSEICTTSPTATATSPAITVNPNLTPEVTISVTDSDICPGDTVTFTATPTHGGTTPSYQWKIDGNNAGSDSPTFTTTVLTNGQTVTVEITSDENCLAIATANSPGITIEVFPPAPDSPGAITGETEVCALWTNLEYSISAVPDAETYVWSFPTGWSIIAGDDTNSVTVNPGGSGEISVYALNTCGDSSAASELAVTSIDAVPANPGEITSDLNIPAICPPATVNFSVAASGEFEWTLPSGWNILNGEGTNNIEVQVTNSSPSGTNDVSVESMNICGNSTASTFSNIEINDHIIADFGEDQIICATQNSITLSGTRSFGGATLDVTFSSSSSGASGFSNSTVGGSNKNGPFDVTYTPNATDRNNGQVELTMTVPEPRKGNNGNDCGESIDTMILYITKDATISSSVEINPTLCINTLLPNIEFTITDAGTDATVTDLPAGVTGEFNNGVLTISGTPTEAGEFIYTVTTTGDCTGQQTNTSGTITVTPDDTITDAGNNDQEICINTPIAEMTFPVNESVTGVNSSGLPAGISGSLSGSDFIISGTPTESGIFNYTLTTTGSCESATTTGIITVQPDITISSPANKDNQTVCINTAINDIQFTITDPGTGANISGDFPAGLNGNFNNGIFTISGSPTEAGTFAFIVNTEGNCATPTQSGIITVTPDPTATISYSGDFCTSQTNDILVNLDGTGDYQGGTFSAEGTSADKSLSIDEGNGTITASTSDPGTYTVTYLGPPTCVRAEATTTVTIEPEPTVDLSYSSPFCTSDNTFKSPIFENGVGAWEGGTFSSTPGGLNIDATTGEINPANSSPGDYTVTYTIPATVGCVQVEVTAIVTITQLPQPSIAYPEAVCSSETSVPVDFDTTPIDYQDGIFSGTSGLSIDASGTINPSNSAAGVHTISYTIASDGSCDEVVVTDEIEIFNEVFINTQPLNTGVCSSETATFEVVASGSNLTYQWYRNVSGTPEAIAGADASILNITNVTLDDAGSYYVVVTGEDSCSEIQSEPPATLNVDQNITITEPTEDITICEDAQDEVIFTFKGHANKETLTFDWYKDGVIVSQIPEKYIITVTNPDENDPLGEYTGILTIKNPEEADSGIYFVKVDGPDYFTCSAATSPSFKFTVNTADNAPSTEPVFYCKNDTATALTATANGDNELKWYDASYNFLGDNVTPPTDVATSITYYVTQTKNYTTPAGSIVGCESDYEQLVVTVYDKPEPISENTMVFEYCFEEEVTSAPTIETTGSGETVVWYDMETGGNQIAAPLPDTSSPGTSVYWISQTTNDGCESDRARVEYLVKPLPNVQINLVEGYNSIICLGAEIRLIASNAFSYEWFLDNNSIGTSSELVYTPTTTGEFTFTVVGTENGCSNSSEFIINVDEVTVAGTLSAPDRVCIINASGELTLTGQVGEITKWEYKSASTGDEWTDFADGILATTRTFSGLDETTGFRVTVESGVCNEETQEVEVAVDALPEGGQALWSKNNERLFLTCQNPVAGYASSLNLSDYVGEISGWEYRGTSATSWTPINSTEPSLTAAQIETAVSPGDETTVFRAILTNGSCDTGVYSETAMVSVIQADIKPTPVEVDKEVICIGDEISLSSETGYEADGGKFSGGAFDQAGLDNNGMGWEFNNPDGSIFNFEGAVNNGRSSTWGRMNPHGSDPPNEKVYNSNIPADGDGQMINYRTYSGNAGNKGFALVTGDSDSHMQTPVFSLTGMDEAILTWDQAYNLTAGAIIVVEISTNGGASYPITNVNSPIDFSDNNILYYVIGDGTEATGSSGNFDHFGEGIPDINQMSIDLGDYIGQSNLRIRFTFIGTMDGDVWAVDNIEVPQGPQEILLQWYYDDDINDPYNELEAIDSVNVYTVDFIPRKIGWNDFEVQTRIILDSNGDQCLSIDNFETIRVWAFDRYTTEVSSIVGACGSLTVALDATVFADFQNEYITEYPTLDGYVGSWQVEDTNGNIVTTGFTMSNQETGSGLPPMEDPSAVFTADKLGDYNFKWILTPTAVDENDNLIDNSGCPPVENPNNVTLIDCTTLDFDGIDDHIVISDGYSEAQTIEAWIRPEELNGATPTEDAVIISNANYELYLTSGHKLVFKKGNRKVSSNKQFVPDTRWYHIAVVFDGSDIKMYIDGIEITDKNDNNGSAGSTVTANKTIIGARFVGDDVEPVNYFSGWIEEVRIWNSPIPEKQIRFMMNQRLKLDGSGTVVTPLQGEVVPNLFIDALSSYHSDGTHNLDQDNNPFYNIPASNLVGYYRLISANPDIDNLITFPDYLKPNGGETPDHSLTKMNGRMFNIETDQQNTSPTPYFDDIDQIGQNWETDNTWARPNVWDPPNSNGIEGTPIEWNIARINTNINSANKNITMLGLLSITAGKELSIIPDHFIRISHYLLLDGNMDLEGESQLLQDHGSILDNDSDGWLERDQQGRMSSFNYNYWTSPVSITGSDNNSGFMLNKVMLDGTLPNNPKGINWTDGYFSADGSKDDPIIISNEWIWDFRGGDADIYGDWLHLGSDYMEIVGAGFSMKGTDGIVPINTYTQNYVFKGKPNNGNIPKDSLKLENNQNFLIGNPYPSALDGWEFIKDNIKNNGQNPTENVFNGSLYFWDHFSGKTHILEDYIGGYGVLNLSAIEGIPAISSDWRIDNSDPTTPSTKKPTRYIPIAQGFFVNSQDDSTVNPVKKYTGKIIFKNTQRVFVTENETLPSIFLQQEDEIIKGATNTSSIVDSRVKIRLKYESPMGYHRQILVTMDENTSNGFDIGYDAPLIENNLEDMYWWFGDHGFVIQGVPDFEKEQVLPLVIKTKEGGEFKVKIDEIENWPNGKELYLNDKLNDTIHDILKEPYIGSTEDAGEIKDRFELIFFKEQAQDPVIPDPDPDDVIDPNLPIIDDLVGISYSTFSKQVKISNFDLLEVDKVMIFDMGGKLIQEFDELPTEQEILLGMRPVRSGVYIVKVFCQNGICNKKIIVK